ncbi:FUSC family protein [Paraburkholderia pallida]|uniref:FUSC family protein n=1 Tax=Paraburkholderia pallida TaxID=2547399 RepID=A0A4P7DA12_9BURK|nr:FUSC family protein [Paraburkholderia pallida]QBR03714.1 FUSC family protein [Paraburkholderia pallida]
MSLVGIREELITYRNDDFPRLLHALKSALAVVLSMLICMRLELRAPGTAMVSAAIVMIHQQSGMVIGRAFYRALGVFFGSLAGLTLICLFAQQPPLFLAGLAIWVGIFVAGSSYYKNFQSYGFVLSGYAASITAVPEWSNPYDVSTNVIHTVSEVVIGVAMSSLISALVFPQRVTPTLISWRYTALAKILPVILSAAGIRSGSEPMREYVQLVSDSATIDGLRAAAVFEEPEMRLRHESLVTLEQAFLDLVTRVHAIYKVREISADVDPVARTAVERILARLHSNLSKGDLHDLRTEDGLEQFHRSLKTTEHEFPDYIGSELEALSAGGSKSVEMVETVGAEVYAVIWSLRRFSSVCRTALRQPTGVSLTFPLVKVISFMRTAHLRSSGTIAMIAGLRAATAVGFVGATWIVSEWTNGFSALVSVAISSGLYSLSNAPVRSSWQAFVGCLLAWILGFFFEFLVFPLNGDVTLVIVCVAMAVSIGSYVNTFSNYAVLGAGFNLYFLYILSPTNPQIYNPPLFLDRGLALMFGIACAATAFSLIVPREGEWLAKVYSRRIRRLIVQAAEGDLSGRTTATIGASMRDLITGLVTVPNISRDFRETIIKRAFGALWVTQAILEVRRYSESDGGRLSVDWEDSMRRWRAAIVSMAAQATPDATEFAIRSTQDALKQLRVQSGGTQGQSHRAVFDMRVRLISAKIALYDLLEYPIARKGVRR